MNIVRANKLNFTVPNNPEYYLAPEKAILLNLDNVVYISSIRSNERVIDGIDRNEVFVINTGTFTEQLIVHSPHLASVLNLYQK